MSVSIHFGLTDHLPPELKAMTMARYSRDVGSVMNRLPTEEQIADSSKTKDNMQKYYIGYGHKSVGQLAGTDIFFEGVSQIAAKAIENHPLYNGQKKKNNVSIYRN